MNIVKYQTLVKHIEDCSSLPKKGINSKYPIYVIEGIDASGKSSLGREIAKNINAHFHEYPLAFKPALNAIDDNATAEARFMFYMGYNLQTSNDIRLLANDKPVVCIRYIYSTMVYHLAKGVDENLIFNVAKVTPLLRPERVFFLDVSNKEVQMSRMKERGLFKEDIRMLSKMDDVRKLYLKLSPIMPNFTYIDTSDLNKSEVISEIIKHI